MRPESSDPAGESGGRRVKHAYRDALSEAQLSAHDRPRDAPGDEAWDRLLDQVIALVGDGGTWVEVGIGTGAVGGRLSLRNRRVVGVDVNMSMLAAAVNRYSALDGTLVAADAAQLPLQPSSASVIIVAHVLHLSDQWRHIVREVVRVLGPAGWLLHTGGGGTGDSGIGRTFREFLGPVPTLPGATSEAEICAALVDAGLTRGPTLRVESTVYESLSDFIDRLEHNPFAWHPAVEAHRLTEAARLTRSWAVSQGLDLETANARPAAIGLRTFRQAAHPVAKV